MGHAGAIITGRAATAAAKVEALTAAGAVQIPTPADIGITVRDMLKRKAAKPVAAKANPKKKTSVAGLANARTADARRAHARAKQEAKKRAVSNRKRAQRTGQSAGRPAAARRPTGRGSRR